MIVFVRLRNSKDPIKGLRNKLRSKKYLYTLYKHYWKIYIYCDKNELITILSSKLENMHLKIL